jgi:peptidoglycan/xylan/chitin deacetylase (PgdA/CDA1 family)
VSVAADFALMAWNGIDAQMFQTYNTTPATDSIGIYDRNFGTSVNPNAFRIVVSVSSGHIVQTVRPYGTTGAVAIPLGGYVVTSNGTSLGYLSHYQPGDILQVVPTSTCEDRTIAGVPIVTYHSLGSSSAAFESHLQAIQALGYNTISLDQLVAYLSFPSTPLPENPLLISFDDGYDNQFAWAPDLLEAYGMIGNFFIITSYPGSTSTWASWSEINDALVSYPDNVVLGCHSDSAHYQVTVDGKLVAAYMTPIGGETEEQFYDRRLLDMLACRETLYEETGVDTVSIAWPFGSHDDGLVNQAIDAGFEMMVSTFPGLNHPDNDGALGNVRRFGGDLAANFSVAEATMDHWVICP